MHKIFAKLGDLKFTILLEGIIGVIALAISFIGFVYNQYGWTIGIASGTIVSIISTLTVFSGSDAAIRNNKTGTYLLFYFARLILFVGTIVAFSYFQYRANVEVMNYSVFGALIGYTPMFILLIVGQLKTTKDMDRKIQEKDKE